MHFYAWSLGLKTGQYYLRTRPKADAIQFTVDQEMLQRSNKESMEARTPQKGTDETAQKLQFTGGSAYSNPSSPQQTTPGACPLRRKGQPEDEECLMCGS